MGKKSNVNIFEYLDVKQYLKDLFSEFKKQGKAKSYVAFSELLGFGVTPYIHQVVSGYRKLTEKSAKRIAGAVPLRKLERKYFLLLVKYANAEEVPELQECFSEILNVRSSQMESDLEREELEYLSQWYHPIVRELVSLNEFQPDPKWISKSIQPQISVKEASYSFELLQKIGYIRYDIHQARWIQTEKGLEIDSRLEILALSKFHQEVLDVTIESLFRLPPEDRDFAAMSFSISEDGFNLLKQKIAEFKSEIAKTFGTVEKPQKIVQLNLQLIKLVDVNEVENKND